MTSPATPEAAPTPEEMHRLALLIAVLGAKEDDAKQAYTRARKAAEPRFALARKLGIPQAVVTLPGGIEAGKLALKQGAREVHVDEDALLALVAGATPSDVEDYVTGRAEHDKRTVELLAEHAPDLLTACLKPGALNDGRAVKILAEHAPDLVECRIRPAVRGELQDYLEKHDGAVPDPATGEPVQVATITQHDPTGDFSWTGKTAALPKVRKALESGRLVITETGEVIAPIAGEVVAPEAIEGGETVPVQSKGPRPVDPDNDHRFEQAGVSGYEL